MSSENSNAKTNWEIYAWEVKYY